MYITNRLIRRILFGNESLGKVTLKTYMFIDDMGMAETNSYYRKVIEESDAKKSNQDIS